MRKLLIYIFIFVLLVTLVSAQLANSPWPMFHGIASHGGQSEYDTSGTDGTVEWTYEVGDGIESSPVIGIDGTIYFGCHDGFLYALNPDGSLEWKFKVGEKLWDSNYDGQWKAIMATPAIASDGTIYTFSSSHYLIAVNPDGTEKWRYYMKWSPDFWSSPAIGSDGTIYVGSSRDDNSNFKPGLHAINPDGSLKWIHEEGSGVTTPPSIGSDGTIYIGAGIMASDKSNEDAGMIVAITPSGKKKWDFKVKLWVEGASSVAPDGTIYTGTKEGDIYALTPEGKEKWRFSTDDGVSAAIAIGPGGNLYVGSWDAYFYSLTPEGTLRWKYKTPDAFEGISSSAAIGSDGTIYVGSNSGMFYAFNPDGAVKFSIDDSFHSGIVTGPAVGSDGKIYYGSWNKKLYAIGFEEKAESAKELASTTWHPKDEGVECFTPESEEIKQKCDEFCTNYPHYCPGYFERHEIDHHEEKNIRPKEPILDEKPPKVMPLEPVPEKAIAEPGKKISDTYVEETTEPEQQDLSFFQRFIEWLGKLF